MVASARARITLIWSHTVQLQVGSSWPHVAHVVQRDHEDSWGKCSWIQTWLFSTWVCKKKRLAEKRISCCKHTEKSQLLIIIKPFFALIQQHDDGFVTSFFVFCTQLLHDEEFLHKQELPTWSNMPRAGGLANSCEQRSRRSREVYKTIDLLYHSMPFLFQ